jgi:hypothetical protein
MFTARQCSRSCIVHCMLTATSRLDVMKDLVGVVLAVDESAECLVPGCSVPGCCGAAG